MKRFKEAEVIYADVVKSKEEVLGPYHPLTLSAMNTFANILCNLKRPHEAEKIELQVLERCRSLTKPDKSFVALVEAKLKFIQEEKKRQCVVF